MAEIDYVLTNEAIEGMVKIGRTSTSVQQRIRELGNTSQVDRARYYASNTWDQYQPISTEKGHGQAVQVL